MYQYVEGWNVNHEQGLRLVSSCRGVLKSHFQAAELDDLDSSRGDVHAHTLRLSAGRAILDWGPISVSAGGLYIPRHIHHQGGYIGLVTVAEVVAQVE